MDNSKLPDFRAGIGIQGVSDGSIVSGRVDSEEAILLLASRTHRREDLRA